MADKLETVEVKGVEVLRVGTFNAARGGRQTFTEADLDELAAAHAALVEAGQWPTVYLGHNSPEGSGLPEPPAVGRIVSLVRKGDRLVADLAHVPALVARLMDAKAYGARSIEGVRATLSQALAIGDRKFRQVITGLALLGKSLPAVNGLADVERLFASGADGETWVEVPFQLAKGGADLEEVLAAVDALAAGVEELIRGRAFAPAIRQRLRMLKADLRRIAGPTVEASMGLKTALGLADDASDGDVVAALIALAGPADPATALAVIAEILGIPDGEPAAIVAKVRELAGGGAAAAPMDEGGDTAMAAKFNAAGESGADRFQVLQAQHAELLERLAKLEGDQARAAAAAEVDQAIGAGKFVPAQRESLVRLRLLDPRAFMALAAATPVSAAIGERGTSAGAANAAELEPSAADVAGMMRAGYSEAEAKAALRLHAATLRGGAR